MSGVFLGGGAPGRDAADVSRDAPGRGGKISHQLAADAAAMMAFEDVCRLAESLLAPGVGMDGAFAAAGADGADSGRLAGDGAGASIAQPGGKPVRLPAALPPMPVPDLAAQKRAIIGYPDDVRLFMDGIARILDAHGLRGRFEFPEWYGTPEEAVFEEVWGKAGLAQWWKPPYDQSGSAKIIGDDVFFLVDGRMRRMPQTIGKHRREQLVRAFLLLTPDERLDRDFHEIYLHDGCRVTVFKGALAKGGRDAIILRRYIIPEYTFEEQAARGTIPAAAIPLFESMVDVGFNVAFCGSVRSAKTTFLSTWQRHEDPALEGVMVETDPEIPLHRLMPGAPVVQLVCDGERLSRISRNLLRSDADYFIFAEARDGIALDMALRISGKSAGRMKMTFHTRDPLSFPEDVAVEIVRSLGGDLGQTAVRAARAFDYIFHFVPLPGGAKRLDGIYEISVGADAKTTGGKGWAMREVCRYDAQAGGWRFLPGVSEGIRARAAETGPLAFARFESELAALAESGVAYCDAPVTGKESASDTEPVTDNAGRAGIAPVPDSEGGGVNG